jgi:hypothetical protein
MRQNGRRLSYDFGGALGGKPTNRWPTLEAGVVSVTTVGGAAQLSELKEKIWSICCGSLGDLWVCSPYLGYD